MLVFPCFGSGIFVGTVVVVLMFIMTMGWEKKLGLENISLAYTKILKAGAEKINYL